MVWALMSVPLSMLEMFATSGSINHRPACWPPEASILASRVMFRVLPEVSITPPLAPPLALALPAKRVVPSDQATTWPPSRAPSAISCAPFSTVVLFAEGELPLPWKLPPTATEPPLPWVPLASTLAVDARLTSLPRTLIWPPSLPLADKVPLTWVWSALPSTMVPPWLLTESAITAPPMLITESRCLAARCALMATTPSPTSMCPALSTPPFNDGSTESFSPAVPPTARLIRPSPWKSSEACGPVARVTCPLRAWITPRFSTWAPSSATTPLSCTEISPSLRTRPLSWMSSLPLSAKALSCSSVIMPAPAIKALAETRALGPNQMPAGLSRMSLPLEVSMP
ncbi:hypothetical protein D9M71_269400 [compost metagenome]